MASNSPPPGRRVYDEEIVTRAEHQDIVTPAGEVVGQDMVVAETVDNVGARRSTADWLSGLVYFIFAVIEILIALRVLLKLVAANPESGFSRFIYAVTGPFVAPFRNIINDPATGGGNVFELSSILAIVVYLLLSWIIAKLLQLLIDRPASGVSATRTVGRRNQF